MYQDGMPLGYLLKRAEGGEIYFEAKWRDSRGAQRKRRLGRAWLEGCEGGYRPRSGRVRPGYLDERRGHVEMAKAIAEHEEELERELVEPEATFDDGVERWLDYLRNEKRAKPATIEGYKKMFCLPTASKKRGRPHKARLMRTFGGRRLAEIETADVARFLNDMDREGLSARMVNKHRAALHSMFEYAKRRDTFGLRDNPAAETTRRPEGGTAAIEILEPWEVGRVADVARAGLHRAMQGYRHSEYSAKTWTEWQRINEQDAALFVVAAFTGLRMGELRALRWKDIDFGADLITVSRAFSWDVETSTKSRRIRTVPLARQAREVLVALRRRDRFTGREDFVFCRPDGDAIDSSAIRNRFRAAQEAAGVRLRRFHDLRHTFGSLMIRRFDLLRVQSMMGHASITTTERYLHARPRADDVEKMSDLFEAGGADGEVARAGRMRRGPDDRRAEAARSTSGGRV
jgi:integrase